MAGRPQDLTDIESVIIRQKGKLDVEYIRQWLDKFSHLLQMKDISERFEEPWKRFMKEGEI